MGFSLSTLGSIVGTALGGPPGAALGGMLGSIADGGGPRDALMGGIGGYALGSAAGYLGLGGGAAATSATVPASALSAPSAAAVPGPHAMVPPPVAPTPMVAPPVAGGVGSNTANVGIGALDPQQIQRLSYTPQPNAPMGFSPKITDVAAPTPFLGGGNASPITGAPVGGKDSPFWESPWMKYGLGGLMLAGMFEEPEYEELESPDPRPSILNQYYADVAEYGIENVPTPPQLSTTPRSGLNTYGSRRSAVRRI